MSVFQAALIALFYAFAKSSFNAGLGGYVLSQPLVAGAVTGLLLGDPISGAAVGAVLNLGTLALSNLRLRLGPDIALAGYVGIPVLLLNGVAIGAPMALVVFAALATIGMVLSFMRGLFNSVLAHWADDFAGRGDPSLVAFIAIAPAQLWLFATTFLPAFVMLRMSPSTLLDVAAAIPPWVQGALVLSQSLLAAVGIAMSLRILMQGSSAAYFVLGWLASPLFGLVPATLLGAGLATVHAFVARKRMESGQDTLITDAPPSDQSQPGDTARASAPAAPPAALTASDVRFSFLAWVFFHDAALNFERFQNMGFAVAMAPVARRLYADAADRAACLRRHLALFATEFAVGSLLVGVSAALEERRARGDAISEAEFVGAKTGLMAGLGVAGDTLMTGVVTALGVAVGAALAMQHSLLGPFLFVIYQSAAVLLIAYASFRAGYAQASQLAGWARLNDWTRAGLFGALRLGTFVLGALVIHYVPVQLPPDAVIVIGDARIALQTALFDRLLPGLPPMAVVAALWWLMRHRGVSPISLVGGVIVLSAVVCLAMQMLGWL